MTKYDLFFGGEMNIQIVTVMGVYSLSQTLLDFLSRDPQIGNIASSVYEEVKEFKLVNREDLCSNVATLVILLIEMYNT